MVVETSFVPTFSFLTLTAPESSRLIDNTRFRLKFWSFGPLKRGKKGDFGKIVKNPVRLFYEHHLCQFSPSQPFPIRKNPIIQEKHQTPDRLYDYNGVKTA